jgi:peptide/nickel transport system permease protein
VAAAKRKPRWEICGDVPSSASDKPVMLILLSRRVFTATLTLVAISAGVFAAIMLLPGDAADIVLGQASTEEARVALQATMHLNEPAPIRYLHWLVGVLNGDLGTSLLSNNKVVDLIGSRLSNTLLLAGLTTAVALPVSLALGITAAVWRNSFYDRAMMMLAVASVSVPEFLVATLAVIGFAVELRWFPALSKADVSSPAALLSNFILPVLTLAFGVAAQLTRMTRTNLIAVLDSGYVEMARLKGLRQSRIVLHHALPNAAGPIANAAALSLSALLGGVIIVEVVFDYPGLAKLMVDAVATRDMPLIQACAMVFCAGYMVLVLIADLFSILTNPRLAHS